MKKGHLIPILLSLSLPFHLCAKRPAGQVAFDNAMYGLQQMRTEIPERLWKEEFALLIDKSEFEQREAEVKEPALCDSRYPSTIGVGSSEYYFLYAATTGETIRLEDPYLEFLNSPYWNTPEAVRHLYYLQHHYMKVAR